MKSLLRFVPYVGEVSPRHEAATKTSASSQAAPEARKGNQQENTSWPSSKSKRLYNPPSATVREGGREKWLACTWTPSRLESKMAPVKIYKRFIKA